MQPKARNDRYREHPLPDDFPISTLGSYREKIVAPGGPFDSQGSWTQVFGIHSTGNGSSRVGTLTLKRRAGDGGKVSLGVRHEKHLTGSAGRRVTGAMRSRRILDAVLSLGRKPSTLSTPGQWSFRTRVLDERGEVIPDAGLKRRAAYEHLGAAIQRWGGRFYTGPDVGTTERDLAAVRRHTKFVVEPQKGRGPGDIAVPASAR